MYTAQQVIQRLALRQDSCAGPGASLVSDTGLPVTTPGSGPVTPQVLTLSEEL